jgi:hypothetical protein
MQVEEPKRSGPSPNYIDIGTLKDKVTAAEEEGKKEVGSGL